MFYIAKLWRVMLAWFGRKREAQKVEPKRPQRKRREKDHDGAHYYLGDLLDHMDMAFEDLPKLRKVDRDAFDVFSRLGASVISSDGFYSTQIEPHIVQRMPALGAFYLGATSSREDHHSMRFGYFIKCSRPSIVQPTSATIYKCGATFNDNKRGKASVCVQFYVSLDASGHIEPLKISTPIYHKPGFCRTEWKWPQALVDWAGDHGASVQDYAAETFSLMANAAALREAGLTVRVRKKKMAMAFAIDMERTPYFFADREKTVNVNGSTKKIFHVVRGHWRNTDAGRMFIKPHFRGLREFLWNGYEVKVGLAGMHGRSMFDFAAASHSEDEIETGMGVAADKMANVLNDAIV